MTTHRYRDLGLVNTREMFQRALTGHYAVPAYNFNNMEQIEGIIAGCVETKSPVILQCSGSARKYLNAAMVPYLVKGALEMMRDMGGDIPVALHLDHGANFELAKSCIDSGFSSVMIDGSHLPFEENMQVTRQVVEYAHGLDVTVEGEEVETFVRETGVDSLAISIGTSHGAYKFKVKPGEAPPPLRFDILEEVERRVPGFPIVLHGASSVMPEYVTLINQYGGRMDSAVGVSEDQIQRACRGAVCKVNIDSDGRLAMTAIIRKILAEKPGEFDLRKYLGPARDELTRMVKYKNEHVLGSAGKA
jgi:fructose-bisphosphate aldolase class II